MRDLRDAIAAGTLAETAAALRAGTPPSTEPVAPLSPSAPTSASAAPS
jgi:hypothetical protein